MIERKYEVPSRQRIENNVSLSIKDIHQKRDNIQKNQKENRFSNMNGVLNLLQYDMMQIFMTQFHNFKQICKNKTLSSKNTYNQTALTNQQRSEKYIESHKQNRKGQDDISVKDSQSLKIKNNKNESKNLSQSFILSKTSHQIKRNYMNQTDSIHSDSISNEFFQEGFLSPQSKKFMKSTGFIKKFNKSSEQLTPVSKNHVSIRLIDYQQNQQPQINVMPMSNNMIYNKLMFVKND